ncbi:hypothetical protein MPSEU_000159300 [Mayamaea pseudoterrestris]|nr:hypothetical protein MPSEU_000159300 [Mayamaea pseudoterrestris]
MKGNNKVQSIPPMTRYLLMMRFQVSLFLIVATLSASVAFVVAPRNARHDRLLSASAITATASSLANHTVESQSAAIHMPHAYIAEQTRRDFEILDIRDDKADETNINNEQQQQLHDLVYLDSAATSQKPRFVLDAVNYYYTHQNANVHRGAHSLSRKATEAYEAARDKVANFVNAYSRNEVVFTSGATEAINLVAQTYGRAFLKEGDEIVLTEAEHHANLVPWQMLRDQVKVQLKFVRVDTSTGCLDLEHFESLLSHKTKFVSFQHVSNVLGCVNPVQRMVQMVRQHASPDAKILLDACQSVPHMPVDVQTLGVDFLAASGHKMCGPTGIGFLWGRQDLLNSMPPYQGGGEMIDTVTLEQSTWQLAPARFEAGTPAIAQAVGLGAAIDYLQQIGMDEIEAYEHELAVYLFDQLSQVPGITILGPQRGQERVALCAFVHESVHPSDLSSFLDMEGVAVRAGHHCCQPLHHVYGHSHSARASLYFYNTKEEIDVFIDKLQATIAFFTSLETTNVDGSGGDFVPFI